MGKLYKIFFHSKLCKAVIVSEEIVKETEDSIITEFNNYEKSKEYIFDISSLSLFGRDRENVLLKWNQIFKI